MPSSRGSSQLRDQTCVFCSSCITGRFFITEPPETPHMYVYLHTKHIHICFRRSIVHATQLLFSRAQTFFLQPGFRQVRSNLDFKTRGCKLEANRANVALRNMSLDSHVFKIGTFYIQTKVSGFLEKLRHLAIRGLYYSRQVSKRQC